MMQHTPVVLQTILGEYDYFQRLLVILNSLKVIKAILCLSLGCNTNRIFPFLNGRDKESSLVKKWYSTMDFANVSEFQPNGKIVLMTGFDNPATASCKFMLSYIICQTSGEYILVLTFVHTCLYSFSWERIYSSVFRVGKFFIKAKAKFCICTHVKELLFFVLTTRDIALVFMLLYSHTTILILIQDERSITSAWDKSSKWALQNWVYGKGTYSNSGLLPWCYCEGTKPNFKDTTAFCCFCHALFQALQSIQFLLLFTTGIITNKEDQTHANDAVKQLKTWNSTMYT